jgi:NAD(P)H dehydrogenase (quinone)
MPMHRLALIYYSGTGMTHQLAMAIKQGAGVRGQVEVATHRIVGSEIELGRFKSDACLELVDSADAVVFGSPTYMGGPAAQFKAFADASSDRWDKQRWAGKVAAGFTTGSCPSGDQLVTLQYFTILAAQHGMVWIGLDIPGGYDKQGRNRSGSQLGICAQSEGSNLHESDLRTAEYLGLRVAELAVRLSAAKSIT